MESLDVVECFNAHQGPWADCVDVQDDLVCTFTFIMLNKLRCHAHFKISQSDYLFQYVDTNSHTEWQTADLDQLVSSEANWSGSTLFAKVGYIQVQQDQG